MAHLLVGLAGCAVLSVAGAAEATLRLELFNPLTSTGVIVTDQGAGDTNPTPGVVTFLGSLGAFTVNVTTGISIPPVAGPCCSLDLSSVNVLASGPGTLIILLENDSYPGTSSTVLMNVGGTITAGSASFQGWVNPGNAVPPLGPDGGPGAVGAPGAIPGGSIAACSPALTFTSTAFSGSCAAGFVAAGPYALFGQATLTFAQAGQASFDQFITVPEPSVLLLLGSGLTGIALWRRRFSRWSST